MGCFGARRALTCRRCAAACCGGAYALRGLCARKPGPCKPGAGWGYAGGALGPAPRQPPTHALLARLPPPAALTPACPPKPSFPSAEHAPPHPPPIPRPPTCSSNVVEKCLKLGGAGLNEQRDSVVEELMQSPNLGRLLQVGPRRTPRLPGAVPSGAAVPSFGRSLPCDVGVKDR